MNLVKRKGDKKVEKIEETLQSIDETLKRIEVILKKDKDISPSQRIKECVSNLHLTQER